MLLDSNLDYLEGYLLNQDTSMFSIDLLHSSRVNSGKGSYTITGMAQRRKKATFEIESSSQVLLAIFKERGQAYYGMNFFSVIVVDYFNEPTWFLLDSTQGAVSLVLQGRIYKTREDLVSNNRGMYFASKFNEYNCLTNDGHIDLLDEDQLKGCGNQNSKIMTKTVEPDCQYSSLCEMIPVVVREDLFSKFPIVGVNTDRYGRNVIQ